MSQTRFCSVCGGSLADGDERCRQCRTALADMTIAAPAPPEREASPFVSIWLHPRDTVRGILNTNTSYLVLPLAATGGLFQALSRASDRNAGDVLSTSTVLLLAVTLGPLGGVFGLYIGGWLLTLTGRWLGGTANREEVRASIAWGTVPALWGGLLWIPMLALAGGALFTSDLEAAGLSAPVLLLTGGILIVQAATYIWSIFTGLHSLGEAHGFSAWRALGSSVLAVFVVVVPIIVVGIGLAVVIPMLLRA